MRLSRDNNKYMEKETITITVDVDGSEVTRKFNFDPKFRPDLWNDTIEDMIATIKEAKEVKF